MKNPLSVLPCFPPNTNGFVFAATWDSGAVEVTVSLNGEAERRHMLARTIGGPRRVASGPLPTAAKFSGNRAANGMVDPLTLAQYFAGFYDVSPVAVAIQHFVGGVSFLWEGRNG